MVYNSIYTYSAVASAKRGIPAVIDFDITTGANKSFTYCKQTGEAFPLIERKQGVLEIPMHLALTREDTTGLVIRVEMRNHTVHTVLL